MYLEGSGYGWSPFSLGNYERITSVGVILLIILRLNNKFIYQYFDISRNIPIFVVPNYMMINHSVEHPDRCSIRNWAFFMSIGIILLASAKW